MVFGLGTQAFDQIRNQFCHGSIPLYQNEHPALVQTEAVPGCADVYLRAKNRTK